MQAALPALCLALGFCLPVAAAYALFRRGWRQLGAAEAYREVAQTLGMSVDTRGLSLHGYLHHRPMWIGAVMVGHGRERRTEYRGSIGLRVPMNMGLLVKRRDRRGFFKRRSPNQQTGDRRLDRYFQLNGDKQADVLSLFNDARFRNAFDKVHLRWPDIVLTDHSIRVHLKQPEPSTHGLEALVLSLEGLAIVMETIRGEWSPPGDLSAYVPAWDALAESLDLVFNPKLPSLAARRPGFQLLATIRRQADGFSGDIRLLFSEPIDLGVHVHPQTLPDGYWSIGQDIQVHDPTFNSAFVIKGYDPEVISSLLSETVQRAMLQLNELGQVELSDFGLALHNAPLDSPTLTQALITLQSLARDYLHNLEPFATRST